MLMNITTYLVNLSSGHNWYFLGSRDYTTLLEYTDILKVYTPNQPYYTGELTINVIKP